MSEIECEQGYPNPSAYFPTGLFLTIRFSSHERIIIKELDIITLTRDLHEHGLSRGSRGAVVHCYIDKQGFEVEFVGQRKHSIVLTLDKSDIELEKPA